MYLITGKDILKVFPYCPKKNVDTYAMEINRTMYEFGINTTRLRMAHFLAQIGHESAQFQYLKEIASGEAYDTGRLATRLGNTPEKDGDGQKYKGRGVIQITGTDNYKKVGDYFGQNFLSQPELLEEPCWAFRTAGWYWNSKNLNAHADKDDLLTITKLINGGTNGYAERQKYLDTWKKYFAAM